nr:tetratricopeptide repeat protein [Streptomyces canus]
MGRGSASEPSSERAITYWQNAARTADDRLGSQHPDPLGVRHNLANSYRQAGRTDEALAIEEQLLIDCERVLGARHPLADAVRSAVAVIRGTENPRGRRPSTRLTAPEPTAPRISPPNPCAPPPPCARLVPGRRSRASGARVR